MTSSRKHRQRRSTFDRGMLRRLLVIGGGLAAFGVALYAFFFLSPLRQDPAAARDQVAKAVELLKASNVTAARDAALAAVRSDPRSAEAHLALARAQLLLGDGLGAEAEVRRAVDNGFDARLVHQLAAHALLLQGKPDLAIDEVEKTNAANRSYGLRIRARALTALGNLAGAQASLAEAVRIAPRDADVWTDVGRFRFTAGDLPGAIEASERAVALDRGNIDALLLRGELVRSQFGLTASLPWFEAALQRDPQYHEALIEYAATLGDAGRSVDMLAATRRALAARPNSAEAVYLQAVLAARAGNYDLARGLVVKLDGPIDSMPGMLLLAGTLDLQTGDTEQAIEKLRQLLDRQPMNLQARKLLAVALLRSDAARNAIDVLRPAIERSDADPYALTLAARGFERIGDRATADKLLDRAARPERTDARPFAPDDSVAVLAGPAAQNPNDPGATVPLIRALIASGDTAGALARAQQLTSANPGAPASHIVLGDLLMALGRTSDAVGAYKIAADMRFDEPTMLRLVDALDRSGRRREAANALALFVSQNPANIAALRLSAHWQVAGGAYDAAIETLEGLRARVGDRDAALNAELSAAYAGAGNETAARDYGEAAYTLAPANPAAADAFGWALFQTGDLEGAAELLAKATKLAPDHPGVRARLAEVQAALGRKPQARAQAGGANPGS